MKTNTTAGTGKTIKTASADYPVSHYAWKTLAGSVSGYAMDGFDLLILGFMLPAIAASLHLTSTQAGSLVTATLIGAVVGGLIFGALSDHYGRVRMLTWTIVLFAVFTGLCAFSRRYGDLLIWRTLAGVGLGGEFGIGMALAAEAWPASKRAQVSSYVALGWQAGVLLASLLVPLLLPLLGWRGIFALGAVPALGAWAIRNCLHEPAIFSQKTAASKTQANSFKLLVFDKATAKTSFGIAILCAVQNFGYYGIMIWLPAFLSKQHGFSLTKSAMWTSVTVLGMAVGILLFGHLADRIGRKPSFLLFQAGAITMVTVYSHLTDPISMLLAGAVMGMFVNGMTGGYGALISEVYPTQARATAQNTLWNIGRAIGGLGPLVVGALAAHYSFEVAIALLAGIYALDMVVTIFLIPELKGVKLK